MKTLMPEDLVAIECALNRVTDVLLNEITPLLQEMAVSLRAVARQTPAPKGT
ncbi:MAG: hypothetical protein HY700_17340 [Gemmatimonadetes bacterium]|nr:hypothetical protein [Gemmatimonadota bacterium]